MGNVEYRRDESDSSSQLLTVHTFSDEKFHELLHKKLEKQRHRQHQQHFGQGDVLGRGQSDVFVSSSAGSTQCQGHGQADAPFARCSKTTPLPPGEHMIPKNTDVSCYIPPGAHYDLSTVGDQHRLKIFADAEMSPELRQQRKQAALNEMGENRL